jgi:hypothetical protein
MLSAQAEQAAGSKLAKRTQKIMKKSHRQAGNGLRDPAIAVPALSRLAAAIAAAEDKGNRIFRIPNQGQGGTGS